MRDMTEPGNPPPERVSGLRAAWRMNPKGVTLDLLRIGIGLVWALNLMYILAPSNRFFAGFQSTAGGFGSSSLGGAGFASFAASHATLFAWGIALLTGYLAVAFLAGLTTRLACVVGGVASTAFIVTQFYSTFALNGTGTDVGPHPIYILVYVILFTGMAGQYFALDHWFWVSGHARFPRLSRYIASPREVPGVVSGPSQASAAPAAPRAGPSSLRTGPDPVYTVVYPSSRTKLDFLALGLVLGLLVAGIGAYTMVAPQSSTGNSRSGVSAPSNLTLTVAINLRNGWPQYTPANFTLPTGAVTITIVDDDAPMNFPGCQCNVSGTTGGVEYVNGTPLHVVPSTNIAHTFDVPSLGINVVSPGMSEVTFTAYFNETGTFTWMCEAPCGTVTPTGPPMGVPGYMTGTISVV